MYFNKKTINPVTYNKKRTLNLARISSLKSFFVFFVQTVLMWTIFMVEVP